MPDHVHMLISIPPKYSVAQIIGYMKGKSSIWIAQNVERKMRNFLGHKFWARGYFVTDEDKIRRETIMRVMCDLSLDYAAMSQRLGLNFASHFEREIESLADFEADGLVRRSPSGIEVSETGRLFIRNIAMSFDNTLAPISERKHSRTI